MNTFANSEISCRLPPLTRFERWLMVTLYASSAITVIASVALVVLHFTRGLP